MSAPVEVEKTGDESGDEYLSQDEEVFDGNDIENNETRIYEESLDSVSYTHLDVYKRQPSIRPSHVYHLIIIM